MLKTDFLIIGSGIAGLTFAVKTARRFPDKTITILTKANTDETNTKYAQGGIAVENEVKEGPERLREIIDWGTKFDTDTEGEFMRGKEGGHSEFRILHHKDVT